jgi:hypothetical protein
VEAAALNLRLRVLTAELSAFRSIAVRDSSGSIAPPLPFGPLDSLRGGPITIGFFGADDGRTTALLVNRDYQSDRSVTLRSSIAAGRPQRFDADARVWMSLSGEQLHLPAGGAMLVRWPRGQTARNGAI